MKSLISLSHVRTVLVAGVTATVLAFAPLTSADEKGRYYKHLDSKHQHGHKNIGKRHGYRHDDRHGSRKGHRHGHRHGWRNGRGHRFHGYRDFGYNDYGYGHGSRRNGFHFDVGIGNGHRGGYGHRKHGRRSDRKGEYLIGGLIIGTALAHALRQRESSHEYGSHYDGPDEDLGDTDYYVHKTLNGECYEVRRDSDGREIRRELPRSRCDW